MKEVILTAEGYEKLKREIEDLSTTKRREVAERLSLSSATLYRLARAGDLPVVRIGRRALRYRESAVMQFMDERPRHLNGSDAA